MECMSSLRKSIIFALFPLAAMTAAHAYDNQISQAGGTYYTQTPQNAPNYNQNQPTYSQNPNQFYNQPYSQTQIYSQPYSQPIQTAPPVIYPTNPSLYFPSYQQTFPDSADFQNTYERNRHPPQ